MINKSKLAKPNDESYHDNTIEDQINLENIKIILLKILKTMLNNWK